jgi:hypothetical protein
LGQQYWRALGPAWHAYAMQLCDVRGPTSDLTPISLELLSE